MIRPIGHSWTCRIDQGACCVLAPSNGRCGISEVRRWSATPVLTVMVVVGGDVSRIEYVLVYDAEVRPDLGTSCVTVANTRCNKYTGAELARIDLDTMWGCQAGAHDDNWCPDELDDAASSPGMTGVAIGYRHEAVSTFFGTDEMVLDERTIMRVEPGV